MDSMDIRQLLREGIEATGSGRYDFSKREFDGFALTGLTDFHWTAKPLGEEVRLTFSIGYPYTAECVRCLCPITGSEQINNEYDITPADLTGEYTEYPATSGGELDLEELVYGEIVLNAPVIWLCSENCAGLCQTCGQPKGNCTCTHQQQGDPRWNALRALLDENDSSE